MKKRLIILITTVALAAVSCIPALAGNSNFSLSPSVGNTVSTTEVKKDDALSAVVNLKTGLLWDHVTFRVRTSEYNPQPATDYVDASSYQKYYLAYWSGYGYPDDYYKLFCSYDAGQWRNGTTVTGVWAP